MDQLFAHSERTRKPFVRHLRRAYSDDVSYNRAMQLRIKELRKEREWTVEHLADMVGLSKSYVSEIENGKKQANQTRIAKFASAFGIPVLELLDYDTLSEEDRNLLRSFKAMTADKRKALLTVADSLKD